MSDAPLSSASPPPEIQTMLALDGMPTVEDWVRSEKRQTISVWISPVRQVKLQVPLCAPPQYVISRLFKLRPGEYYLKPMSLEPFVHTRQGFCARLGLDISDDTLHRLIRGGFIRAMCPSPNRVLVSLQSLWEHLDACSKPGFWNRERRLAYSLVLDAEKERKERRAESEDEDNNN